MAAVYETESAVTERGQTTVPAHVRQRLTVGKPGTLVWRIEANGTVTVDRKREAVSEPDPVLGRFLAFLEADMTAHPERLRPVGADLVERISALVAGVEINLDEPLPDDED
ncbi:type II toxin-antitoxin system PrlF family antitoxin [Magnetospirillum sp. 15-1]|uniref:type II toxin-antitoxin system PrlF family antitoxin n=1 Tax=Magnetospirillum sp. 15-1 TaxID=1979370 RepID=UPI000BBCCAD0|nr:type II toxin-antitoxin system PrlF family antitoxin [Magnetospirillum sp. 15-1]